MQKPKVGVFTNFGGSDSAFSLVNVVATQLQLLIDGGYEPVLFVCPSFEGTGIWASNKIEIRKTVPPDAKSVDICTIMRTMIEDIDVMLCHDLVFLSPQNDEWAHAIRILAKDYPKIRWLHWQHSRGDHDPIEPVPNSEFCYPNEGDLPHVAQINSTTLEHVHYVPHPLDFAYLGWPKLAIQIAEDFDFPFVDIAMIYPSRLDRQKQVEMAIRVFAGLKRAGKSVCLLVADAYATGDRFKEYKKDCLKIAYQELGLTEKEFAFLGDKYEECTYSTPRPVVKALFEMSNIFLQVSNSETSSLVVMEAALAGNLIVLNLDFPPIHHLYKKALALPFKSVINPDTKYYRHVRTADGQSMRIEDNQLFFDDQARNTLIPVLDSQLSILVKRQQLTERWPSRVFKNNLEPLLLKDWNPTETVPFCAGDPEVTTVLCSLDNLEMLKKQIPVLMKECGQIIVVNNGSKDGTKEWLESNPIQGMKVINRDNLGAGPGRNAGLRLWQENKTEYVLMLDGGILPPYNGVKAMKDYLKRHPEVFSVSPEIASCYTTEEEKATLKFDKDTIEDKHTFFQKDLSGTAYCLCRKETWDGPWFSEEGPYGEPGWGVDDNDMAYRWRVLDMLHADFTHEEGMILFRRASGSFKRLAEETGIWPNQYGSVYEKRLVKLRQDYPQFSGPPIYVSCVVLGWNEYPMIAKVVKRLHDEFSEIAHEIIVVDNGSTDETKSWVNNQRYRQHWGTTSIDVETGIKLERTPESEEYWTGNFISCRLEENSGTGHGFNEGCSKALGRYIFYICGDMLPVPGSVKALIEYLEGHPDVSYAGVNAWVSQGENQEVEEFKPFTQELGLGNYAYSYAVIRREVWDSGVRFADKGPFEGAGAGYEECEFANQMYSKGYKGVMFNYPGYYHKRRDGARAGFEERTDGVGIDDRKKWLMTRWNKVSFGIEHIDPNPPERHLRQVAIMNNLVPDHPGPAGYLTMALRDIGCYANQYNTFDNPNNDPVKEGDRPAHYDDYIFVDDGDGNHFDCPEWAHPSKYWAIDMVIPGNDYVFTPNIESYISHGKTFDEFYCTTLKGMEYARTKELNAQWLPMAASPEIHKHIKYSQETSWDWVACWHNCGARIDYAKAAMEKFPNGWVGYAEGENYAKYMNRGNCALNVSRVNEVNMRVMEVTMMGVPLITDRVQGLDQYGYIENEHYLGHSSIEEMLEKIQWVKDHPQEAEEMALKAQKVALSKHTYYRRALRMFAGNW